MIKNTISHTFTIMAHNSKLVNILLYVIIIYWQMYIKVNLPIVQKENHLLSFAQTSYSRYFLAALVACSFS